MALWWPVDAPGLLQTYGNEALHLLLLLVLGWLALRYLVLPLRRLLERGRIDPLVVSFLLNTLRAIILAVVLLAVFQVLGVPNASLLTVLGTIGLAIALSLQNSLANCTAGLLMHAANISRPRPEGASPG